MKASDRPAFTGCWPEMICSTDKGIWSTWSTSKCKVNQIMSRAEEHSVEQRTRVCRFSYKQRGAGMGLHSRDEAYISIAKGDSSWSVQSGLEGEGPLRFPAVKLDSLPLHHKHLTWGITQAKGQRSWIVSDKAPIQIPKKLSNRSPLSRYCTVDSLEELGSKLAISGATYCVAVSIRWVTSPMKIKPGKVQIRNDVNTSILLSSGAQPPQPLWVETKRYLLLLWWSASGNVRRMGRETTGPPSGRTRSHGDEENKKHGRLSVRGENSQPLSNQTCLPVSSWYTVKCSTTEVGRPYTGPCAHVSLTAACLCVFDRSPCILTWPRCRSPISTQNASACRSPGPKLRCV